MSERWIILWNMSVSKQECLIIYDAVNSNNSYNILFLYI